MRQWVTLQSFRTGVGNDVDYNVDGHKKRAKSRSDQRHNCHTSNTPIHDLALSYDRQTMTSPSDSAMCLWWESSVPNSHQTQDSVWRESQSPSAPIAIVYFVPLSYASAWLVNRCLLVAPIQFRTQSDDPISCYRKPVKRADEIKGYTISLVRSTRFP